MDAAAGAAVLTSRGWLATTPPDFQQALLARARWRRFGAGDAIVNPGEQDAALYGIASGMISIVTAMGAPDTPLSHIGHAGFWAGYIPLISGHPTAAATVARSPVFAASITRSNCEALLAANPGWWHHIARLALTYGETAANLAADLLLRDSRRRCAATLLRIADCRFGPVPAVPAQALGSQTDIATVANLSRNTANRILGEFEAEGLIVRHYNFVDLRDPAALRAIVDDD